MNSRCGVPGGGAVAQNEARRRQRILGGQRDEPNREHGQHRLVALADHQQVVAALPLEHRLGRALDRVGRAQPDAAGRRRLDALVASSSLRKQRVLPHIRRRIALKHNRPRIELAPARQLRPSDFGFGLPPRRPWPAPCVKVAVAHLVRQPDDLERAVAFEHARPCRCRCLRRAARAGAAPGCSRP